MAKEVSVIIAAYNSEKFIGRCLRSLLGQNMNARDYEIIIVNDGSNDKTSYALNQFMKPDEELIRVINNKTNIGLPASINKGINFSKGKYIVRVDSDDYVNTNFLSALKLYLDIYKDISAVACDYLLVDEFEKILGIISSTKEPIACGIMFRKSDLVETGLYNDQFRFNEEKELMIRFKKKFKLSHLNLPLYRYRKHDCNMTNNVSELKKYEGLLKKLHKT